MLPYIMQEIYLKVIMKSFEGSSILITQAKVSLQITGLTTQPHKIKDLYHCLIKLKETIESRKYTIREAVQANKE